MTINQLKLLYDQEQNQKTLLVSKIVSPILAIVIALFLLQDIYILKLNFTLFYRLLSIIVLLVYFILSITVLNRYSKFTMLLYSGVLLSGVIMILGIAYKLFVDPYSPEIYLANISSGIQTVFIVIFIVASGARRYLPILLLIPMSIFCLALLINHQMTLLKWSPITNPITTSLFLSLLSYIAEKTNWEEFKLRKSLQQKEFLLTQYKTSIEKELKFASTLHRYIMPKTASLNTIDVYYRPFYNLGGDFYDFIVLNKKKDKIGIFISDVSGHGVSSAFISALMKHYLIIGNKYHNKPHRLLYYLNEYLNTTIGNNFITAVYCIVDYTRQEIIYSIAGHYPPILIDSNASICELPKTGNSIPIGIMKKKELIAHKKYFSTGSITFKKGNKLILYTDGLLELFNTNTYTTSYNNLLSDLLKQYSHLPAQEFITALQKHINSNYHQKQLTDDICVICIDL